METDISSPTKKRFLTRKHLAISLGVIFSIVVLFGVLGYFWLPGFAKAKLEQVLSETLARPVTVQSIDIKPFTLEVAVRGFRIGEKSTVSDQTTFFSFDQLYVDLSAESLIHLAPVVTTISLVAPKIYVTREDKNQFNFSDLIEKFGQTPEEKPQEPKKPTLFSINNISIQNGEITFADRIKNSQQHITAINLSIPFIANFKNVLTNWVEPNLSAKINEAPVTLSGKVLPFSDKQEATLSLKLDDIDLTNIDEYSPIPLGIRLLSGKFDSDLLVSFTHVIDEPPNIDLSGQIALKGIQIENRTVEMPYILGVKQFNLKLNEVSFNETKPVKVGTTFESIAITPIGEKQALLSLPKIELDSITVDRARHKIDLGTILLDGINGLIKRQPDGQLELNRMLAVTASSNSMQSEEDKVKKLSKPIQRNVSAIIPIPDKKPDNRVTSLAQTQAREQELVAPSVITIPLPEHKPQIVARPEDTKQPQANMGKMAEETSSQSAPAAEETDQPWAIYIDQIKLSDGAITFEDYTVSKVVPMHINPLNLTVRNIDLSGAQPVELSLQAQVNQQGSVETKGTLAWAPLAADLVLDLKQVDLVPLQGWFGNQLNILLSKGNFSFQGDVKADGEPLKIALQGKAQLANFNVLDKVKLAEQLRWKSIDVTGIQFINEPLQIGMTTIDLTDLFARVILLADGKINLRDLTEANKAEASPVKPESTPVASAPNQTEAQGAANNKAPLPIKIDKVTLKNTHINFTDQFIKPNYRVNLTELKGQVSPLHPGKAGKVDIRGTIDKSAPLQISGTIDPFSEQLSFDIATTVKGIDLPTFSPYSGKYIGHLIEKGKLSVDVNYQIQQGQLSAENKIFLDQLKIGEKVDSPDAVSLPLDLAISLLKNRKGEINLRFPVSGSINDPQFSISGVVWEAFINLISKALTAPFALLGSFLGDGEELAEITFPSGYATLEPEAINHLQSLADALIDRPELKLEITGYADPLNDYETLKQVLLDRKVKTQKLSETVNKGQSVDLLDEIKLDDAEYARYLEIVYKASDFEKPKNMIGLSKSLPVDEMKQLILTNTKVSDEALNELAEKRASVVFHWLIEQGGVPSERVFVLGTHLESASAAEKPYSKAAFALK
ncbi:MAG TPA: DUF748 domain-containing protein [Nitrosomonas sp.]|nr:DUF748 domain-containing protein [Nitrosomonas sp.]